jgi:Fe-S-cluster containining protein
MNHCRFVTSWGGVARCRDEPFREGFCRFHFECFRNGEITERGLISERLSDQARRREINYHALNLSSEPVA